MRFRVSARWLAVPVVAVAVYAILTADPSAQVATAAGDLRADTAALSPDPEVRDTHRRLAAKLDVVSVRMRHKERLVGELIAGRTDLMAVADEFLRMNREEPECVTFIRNRWPGRPDREAAARNVLEYVGPRVGPADRPAVQGRLDREFAAAFGRS